MNHLTIQEAAKFTGRSEQTIRRMIKRKRLAAILERTVKGDMYFIDKSELGRLKVTSRLTSQTSQSKNGLTSQNSGQNEEKLSKSDINTAKTTLTSQTSLTSHDNPQTGEILSKSDQKSQKSQINLTSQNDLSHKETISQSAQNLADIEEENGTSSSEEKVNFAFADVMKKLVEQHSKDKENLFGLLRTFQDRIVMLEDKIKLLEAPKPQFSPKPKRKWWSLWP